jgi:hypothetical protein
LAALDGSADITARAINYGRLFRQWPPAPSVSHA